MHRIEGSGRFEFDIVGESYHQLNLEKIAGKRTHESAECHVDAVIVCEADNPHDPLAVRVDINKLTVGHFSRQDARRFRLWLQAQRLPLAPVGCKAVVVGGWDRGPDDRGQFGVKLDLPDLDDGRPAIHPASGDRKTKPAPAAEGKSGCSGCATALSVLGAAFAVYVFWSCAGRPGADNAKPDRPVAPAVGTTGDKEPAHRAGDKLVAPERLFVAPDILTYNRFVRAVAANDKTGMDEVIDRGGVLPVEKGDELLVIEADNILYRHAKVPAYGVRVLSGASAGKAGVVPREYFDDATSRPRVTAATSRSTPPPAASAPIRKGPQAEVVDARLVLVRRASDDKEVQKVVVDWKNTGDEPVRAVEADILVRDASGAMVDITGRENYKPIRYTIYAAPDRSSGIAPGETYTEHHGFYLSHANGKTVEVRIVKVSGKGY